MSQVKALTNWNELEIILKADSFDKNEIQVDENELLEHLQSRVRGQDTILKDIAKLVRLQYARRNRERPVCNMLFLGATGTGKTELAKALAEYLFDDEKAMVRFDCSELSGEHSKDRLVGVPTGYVGSESGGQLTRPIISNPKRVILFDEIEKAYSGVFDLFLQLMGEGRLTEQGSGKTVDFSNCIIILTSNAQSEELLRIKNEHKNYHEMLNALKGHLADTKVFRHEILGRIDRLQIFDPLQGIVMAEIALMKIQKLAQGYGVEVDFISPQIIMQALDANHKVSRFGVRELERIIFDLFAPSFAAAKQKQLKQIKLDVKKDGTIFLKA